MCTCAIWHRAGTKKRDEKKELLVELIVIDVIIVVINPITSISQAEQDKYRETCARPEALSKWHNPLKRTF